MLPGPDNIIECPHCRGLAKISIIVSGNTFGAVRWTDGKMEAPMLPDQTKLTKCNNCDKFYWLEDAAIIGEYDWFNGEDAIPEEWKKAQAVQDLDISALVEALDQALGDTPDREKYLRTRLWWALNDLIRQRDHVDVFLHHKELFYNNLQAIDVLLQSSHDGADQLIRAEIAREAGDFDKCLELLSNISEKYSSICDQLKEFVQKKSQVVQKLR